MSDSPTAQQYFVDFLFRNILTFLQLLQVLTFLLFVPKNELENEVLLKLKRAVVLNNSVRINVVYLYPFLS